jgi:hypothetical protein
LIVASVAGKDGHETRTAEQKQKGGNAIKVAVVLVAGIHEAPQITTQCTRKEGVGVERVKTWRTE